MKASPGITYVTGPMGSGKSLFGVRKMTDYIMSGRYVISNVKLKPGWAERMARHTPQAMVIPGSYRRRVKLYQSLYIYIEDLEQGIRFRPPGRKEGRALFVWDEAHNDINNRDGRFGTGSSQDEIENRKRTIKVITQFRKMGYVGFLLSQHQDNTEKALRRIANWEVRLRNQRENVRVLGMRVCPIPFFLAVWYPANTPRIVTRGSSIVSIERYFLSWHKKLYDTMDLYHGLDEDLDEGTGAIMLPRPGELTPELLAEFRGHSDRYVRGEIDIEEMEEEFDEIIEANLRGENGNGNGKGAVSGAPSFPIISPPTMRRGRR